MGAEARSVVVRLSMEAAQYIAEAQRVGTLTEGAMVKAERATQRQSQAINTLGSQSGKAALAAAAGLTAIGKAAVDWESQFAGVEKTVDGTTQQLSALEGELRGLATTMPATHEEIAGVAEAAGQLGVAREDISSFTETMLELGETTNLTAQDAATDIAQMANVLGTMPDEIDNVGAALVALGNDGASTEAQILGMAQRLAGAGAQIGLAESDILAIANAASSMGIEVEAGGSAISRVFTELAKATAQGGPALEQFAEIAGLTTDEFTRLFETDPARAFEAFTSGLDRVNKSGGDVFTTLDQLGLADVRVSQALLGMAASGDLLSDSLDLGAEAFEENTALAEEYAKRLDTRSAEIQIAWNKIKDAGIEAGTAVLPVISEVADVVSDMASAFKSLPAPVQDSATKLLAITAIVGGSLWFGSKVVGSVVAAKDALADLGFTAGKTGGQLGNLGRTAAPILAITGAVTLLGNELAKATGARLDASTLNRDLEALGNDNSSKLLNRFTNDLAKTGSVMGDIVEPVKELATGFGLFGDTDLDISTQNIEEMDEALAGLVEGGQADQAQELFDKFSAAAQDAGKSVEDVTDAFPNYQTAVDNLNASTPGMTDKLLAMGKALGIDQAQSLAANATAWDQVVAATAAGGDTAAATVADINALTQAMRDETAAASGAFDATTNWGAAVIAAQEQIKTGEKGFDEFTEAGQHNRAIIADLRDNWNSMPKAVQNSQAAYDSHRKTFIDTAVALGATRKQARGMADDMLNIPKKVVAKIEADDREAKAKIRDAERGLLNLSRTKAISIIDANNAAAINAINQTKRLLGLIPDETVWINIQQRGLGAQGIGPNRLDAGADGMTVPGQRHPYGDKTLIFAAPGEEVITNRHGEADAFRADRASGRIPAYAGGGMVGQTYNASPGFGHTGTPFLDVFGFHAVTDALSQFGATVHDLSEKERLIRDRDLDRTQEQLKKILDKRQELADKEVEAAKSRLDAELDLQKQFEDSVANMFKSDVFEAGDSKTYAVFPDGSRQELEGGLDSLTADQAQYFQASGATYETNSGLDPAGGLEGDIAELEEAMDLYHQLRARGFDGPAFRAMAANADVEKLRYFASLSEQELNRIENLYDRRENLAGQVGEFAGRDFDPNIKLLRQDYRETLQVQRDTREELRTLNQKIDHLTDVVAETADRTGDRVGAAMNGAVSDGVTGRGRNG